jgi:hypothetical protein
VGDSWDDLVDRIKANHPSAVVLRHVTGFTVELAGSTVSLAALPTCWQVEAEKFAVRRDAECALLDALNAIHAAALARRPRRPAGTFRSSSGGGGGDEGSDAVSDAWIDVGGEGDE